MSDVERERVFNEGMDLFDGGEYRQALECFRRAVEIDEDHGVANSFLGMALGRLGESEKAIGYLKKAIELIDDDRKKSMSHQVLALVLNDLGRVEEAVDNARMAVALDPDEPSKSETVSMLGDPAIAVTFRISEEEEVRALMERGIGLIKKGKEKEGLEILRRALEKDESGVMPNYWVGYALGRLGEGEESLFYLRRVLDYCDDDYTKAQTLVVMALVLNDLGRKTEAVECATDAYTLDSDDSHKKEIIGMLTGPEPTGSLGPLEKTALHRLTMSAEEQGDETFRLVVEGIKLYKDNDRKKALGYFKRAVATDSKDARANHWLGVTLGKLGHSEEALIHLERTLKYSDDDYLNAQTHVCLAVVLNDLGRNADAVESAVRAHELDRDDPHKKQLIKNLRDPNIVTSFGPKKKKARLIEKMVDEDEET